MERGRRTAIRNDLRETNNHTSILQVLTLVKQYNTRRTAEFAYYSRWDIGVSAAGYLAPYGSCEELVSE